MPHSTVNALESCFPDMVDSFQGDFDTHDFIRRLAHRHQQAYVDALTAHRQYTHPFQILHGQIGQILGQRNDLVVKVGQHNSEDIFGQRNSAVIWQKVP